MVFSETLIGNKISRNDSNFEVIAISKKSNELNFRLRL